MTLEKIVNAGIYSLDDIRQIHAEKRGISLNQYKKELGLD